jgi:hypothetical protein
LRNTRSRKREPGRQALPAITFEPNGRPFYSGHPGRWQLERVCVELQHEPGRKIAMMALIPTLVPSHPARPEPSTAIDKAFERAEEIFAKYPIVSS